MKSHPTVRVLLVDDDALVVEAIQRLIERIGYTIAGRVADGLQAVEATRTLRPDIVLMDVKMPKMDGIEAARQIQACCPTPVVLLTAHESPELVKQASEAGIGAYLIKPPQAHELKRAITIALARFEDWIELRRLNAELKDALAQVRALRGLLPICASCKRIRDDEGYWHQVEVYIRDHSEAEFSHGICPDCFKELYPDLSVGRDAGGAC
jgi:AmiR/NasT family two-component response regulator